jgi:hypothetical protein
MLAVDAFIPAPFRSGNYIRTSLRTPTLHSACIYASTSAPRGISIPFLTPYIPFQQSYPCHFPTHFQRFLHSCGEFTPKNLNTFFENDFILKSKKNYVFIALKVQQKTQNQNKYRMKMRTF